MNKGLLSRMSFSSLKVRIIVSALLLILVLMPLIGLTLNDAFKQQSKNAIKNELSAYIYSVLAVAEFSEHQLQMPEQLLENRFNVIQSGLYALISVSGHEIHQRIIWQSASFVGFDGPKLLPRPKLGESDFSEIMLQNKSYLIYSFTVSFDPPDNHLSQQLITIHIIKDQSDFQQQVKKFSRQLWTWLLILMVFLVIIQLIWLLWTLKPLAQFSQEIRAIEEGRESAIGATYPRELQSLAVQLNALLNTEQHQRKRYRNALSDLAHSLKTPLAVLQTQAELSQLSLEQIDIINNIIGHQLKRAQSAAGASWYLGVKVSLISDKLVRVLTKLYREPTITITHQVDPESVFKGDQVDLNEILGNLLDNACKAARSEVLLKVEQNQQCLTICVEDDGKGLDDKQKVQITQRGIRADSYQHGHGIGLAIVQDLVDSYNGNLVVGQSSRLRGAKFMVTFDSMGKKQDNKSLFLG